MATSNHHSVHDDFTLTPTQAHGIDGDDQSNGMLDREARRLTWKDVKWTLRLTHPREDLQDVLSRGGRILVVEYQQSISVVGVSSNLGGGIRCPRLICPICQTATTVLWLNDELRRVGCRKCSRIRYSSTSRQPSDLFLYAKMKLLDLYEKKPESFSGEDESLLEHCREEVGQYLR